MSSSGRIIFAGSPEFALPSLAALCATAHRPVAVLTQPDRPAGRGRQLAASPVKRHAEIAGIPVLQPVTLRAEPIQDQLRSLAPDLLVVVAYGLLLPPAVLAIPARGCVNVHASLLPRWRGASPVQSAILAGDAQTGVSIMALDAGLDTGPVYATRSLAIDDNETAGELETRLAALGAAVLGEILAAILAGTLQPVPQPDTGVTRAGKISKADGTIDWREPAVLIQRRIRAYNPWPGTETVLDGQRLRCWSGITLAGSAPAGPPGQVIAAGPPGIDVQTGAGPLRLTSVQLPGRQRIDAGAFARGYPVQGKILG